MEGDLQDGYDMGRELVLTDGAGGNSLGIYRGSGWPWFGVVVVGARGPRKDRGEERMKIGKTQGVACVYSVWKWCPARDSETEADSGVGWLRMNDSPEKPRTKFCRIRDRRVSKTGERKGERR